LSPKERTAVFLATGVKMALVVLDLIGVGLLGMAASLATGTHIAGEAITASVIAALNVWHVPNPYLLLILVAVFFFVLKSMAALGVNATFAKYLAHLEARKTSTLFNDMMHSGLEKLDDFRAAEVAHGLLGSAQMAFSTSINSVAVLVSESLLIMTICLFLWAVNFLALVGFVLFFGAVGVSMYLLINRNSKLVARQVDSASVQIQSLISDSLQSFRQIHGLQRASLFSQEFTRLRSSLAIGNANLSNLSMLPRYITEIALMLGIAGLATIKLMAPEVIPNETIAIFVAAGFRIIGSMIPLQGAVSLLNQVGEASLQISRLNETYTGTAFAEDQLFDRSHRRTPIVFRNVTYQHKNSARAIVQNLTFELGKGDSLAIVGESGSGKSTIADLILGLRRPDSGEILCYGYRADDFIKLHPGNIAYVPQQTRLIAGTIRDNVLMGIRTDPSSDLLIMKVLKKLGLSDFVDDLPQKLDTRVDSITNALSGGQIQRIGIARALISRPKIIVLDESTSALDDSTRAMVERSIRNFDEKISIITIAHNKSSMKESDKFLCLGQGRADFLDSWDSASDWLENEKRVRVDQTAEKKARL